MQRRPNSHYGKSDYGERGKPLGLREIHGTTAGILLYINQWL